jgi:hypothetical protein
VKYIDEYRDEHVAIMAPDTAVAFQPFAACLACRLGIACSA